MPTQTGYRTTSPLGRRRGGCAGTEFHPPYPIVPPSAPSHPGSSHPQWIHAIVQRSDDGIHAIVQRSDGRRQMVDGIVPFRVKSRVQCHLSRDRGDWRLERRQPWECKTWASWASPSGLRLTLAHTGASASGASATVHISPPWTRLDLWESTPAPQPSSPSPSPTLVSSSHSPRPVVSSSIHPSIQNLVSDDPPSNGRLSAVNTAIGSLVSQSEPFGYSASANTSPNLGFSLDSPFVAQRAQPRPRMRPVPSSPAEHSDPDSLFRRINPTPRSYAAVAASTAFPKSVSAPPSQFPRNFPAAPPMRPVHAVTPSPGYCPTAAPVLAPACMPVPAPVPAPIPVPVPAPVPAPVLAPVVPVPPVIQPALRPIVDHTRIPQHETRSSEVAVTPVLSRVHPGLELSGRHETPAHARTPGTIVISDTNSSVGSPGSALFIPANAAPVRVPSTPPRMLKGKHVLKACIIPTEEECVGLLLSNRKRMTYQHWEDLRLARYIVDPEHPRRLEQAQQKKKGGKIPDVFNQMSEEAFMGSRDAKSLFERWGIIKRTYTVVRQLENATGGDGVADFVSSDPEQTLLEKLGRRLDRASRRGMQIHNLKVSEYHAWVKDPVNGLYAILSDVLESKVSVVRQKAFHSGSVSPERAPRDLLELTDDEEEPPAPAEPPRTKQSHSRSRAGSCSPFPDDATPVCAPSRSNQSGAKANPPRKDAFTPATGFAFMRETQAYHTARAETDRQRLALEERRFQLEQANEKRAEQRVEQENQRIAILREEHQSVRSIAQDSHRLELARLDLARDRNQDLKRKLELDELDRLRTHKRLEVEMVTNMALTIQATEGEKYSRVLRQASEGHILALFNRAREDM